MQARAAHAIQVRAVLNSLVLVAVHMLGREVLDIPDRVVLIMRGQVAQHTTVPEVVPTLALEVLVTLVPVDPVMPALVVKHIPDLAEAAAVQEYVVDALYINTSPNNGLQGTLRFAARP